MEELLRERKEVMHEYIGRMITTKLTMSKEEKATYHKRLLDLDWKIAQLQLNKKRAPEGAETKLNKTQINYNKYR